MKNVVITGVGTVSPYGVGNHAFFSGLAEGKNAIRPISSFDVQSFPIKIAGEVTEFEADLPWISEQVSLNSGVLEKRNAEGFFRDRKVGFGLLAGIEAWQMAKCEQKEQRAGLVLGLGLEQAFLRDISLSLQDKKINWDLDITAPLPSVRHRSEVDLCAKILAEYLELKGPVIVNVSACAAGTLAISQAASLIERGVLDIVLTGAADSMINPLGIGGMACLGAMSSRAEVTACRPFDSRRDGLVMGEGAALFVLESEEHACGMLEVEHLIDEVGDRGGPGPGPASCGPPEAEDARTRKRCRKRLWGPSIHGVRAPRARSSRRSRRPGSRARRRGRTWSHPPDGPTPSRAGPARQRRSRAPAVRRSCSTRA